jgi:hypothetical protein
MRVALALLAWLAVAAPASAQVAFAVVQTPPPPWRQGTEFTREIRARNTGTTPVDVYFGVDALVSTIFPEQNTTTLSSTCGSPTFNYLLDTWVWSLGTIAPGQSAACADRTQISANATPVAGARTVFFSYATPTGTVVDPPFVVAPFGIAPAPVSVPALSSWSAAALALAALLLVSLRTRSRTGSRRRQAAAMPTRRGSA